MNDKTKTQIIALLENCPSFTLYDYGKAFSPGYLITPRYAADLTQARLEEFRKILNQVGRLLDEPEETE